MNYLFGDRIATRQGNILSFCNQKLVTSFCMPVRRTAEFQGEQYNWEQLLWSNLSSGNVTKYKYPSALNRGAFRGAVKC